ncbi:hypothetical protein GCM10010124_19960 [Pilimelia terevasa]|uniref:Uncharacterized protein n=1 Tax=Pilimelia terevasa TaxID=53372 RepID=A0A8J3BR35_9ACTN|nr:hypothetical protein [Pilimelia terevasa]GGK27368.1 hypothetical protein GCM10010124_19960 [Pilimelia terevasa]
MWLWSLRAHAAAPFGVPAAASVRAGALGAAVLVVLASALGAAPAAAAVGTRVCTAGDDRLVELSGLVAAGKGYVVVNDSSDQEARKRVFYLDARCKVTKALAFPSSPRDPEDLALSPDGRTLWVADTGDVDGRRDTIALWRMPVDGARAPELFRLTYPDGPKDAEALLVGRDGVPVVVTKGAKALVYVPAAPLRKGGQGTLQRVGEVTIPRTTTSTPLGALGRLYVTGGATAPGATRVALRTYADAFEWDAPDGDLVKAITSGRPRATALPDEPWGESLAYTADGTRFLTVSETAQNPDLKPTILSYERATVAAAAPAAAADTGRKSSFLDTLSLADITKLVAGVGVLGLLLVVAGIIGITRFRRARAAEAGDDEGARPAQETPGQPVPVAAPVPAAAGKASVPVAAAAPTGRAAAAVAAGRDGAAEGAPGRGDGRAPAAPARDRQAREPGPARPQSRPPSPVAAPVGYPGPIPQPPPGTTSGAIYGGRRTPQPDDQSRR